MVRLMDPLVPTHPNRVPITNPPPHLFLQKNPSLPTRSPSISFPTCNTDLIRISFPSCDRSFSFYPFIFFFFEILSCRYLKVSFLPSLSNTANPNTSLTLPVAPYPTKVLIDSSQQPQYFQNKKLRIQPNSPLSRAHLIGIRNPF